MSGSISELKIRELVRKELQSQKMLSERDDDDCNWHVGMLPREAAAEMDENPDLCEPEKYRGYRSTRAMGKRVEDTVSWESIEALPDDQEQIIKSLMKAGATLVKMEMFNDVAQVGGLVSQDTRNFISAGMAIAPIPNACLFQVIDPEYWRSKPAWTGEPEGCNDEDFGGFRTCEALARSLVCGAVYYAWHAAILKAGKAALVSRVAAIRKIAKFRGLTWMLKTETYQKLLAIELTWKTFGMHGHDPALATPDFMQKRADKFCKIDDLSSAIDTIEEEAIAITAEIGAIIVANLTDLLGGPSGTPGGSSSPTPSRSPSGSPGSKPPKIPTAPPPGLPRIPK